MFSIIKIYVHDVNHINCPQKPLYPWYVTENPYIPYIWGVLRGYLRVSKGMCPIYGYPGVIWTVWEGMCIFGYIYHSLCIYYVLSLYTIYAIHYYYCLYYFLSSLYTISSSCFRTHRSFRHTRTIELYGIGLLCNLLIELYIKYNKKIS